MLIRCDCGWEKSVKDELQGKKAQCPKCGSQFVIEPAPELAAAGVDVPEPPSLWPQGPIAEPDFDFASGETVDTAALGATEDMPAMDPPRPPKRSPWKTDRLATLRGRLKGHYPRVTAASWCLEVYSTVSRIIAAFIGLGAALLILLIGFLLVTGLLNYFGVLDWGAAGPLESVLLVGYALGLTYAAFTAYAFSSVCGAAAELIAGRAAALVDQEVSPCGGISR